MIEAALLVIVGNFVVRLRTLRIRDPHAFTNLNGFDGVDAHDSLSQPSVQTRIPAGVRTKPNRYSPGNDFKGAANRVAILLSGFDLFNHFSSNIGQCTPHDLVVANRFKLLP